ncbi:MAG: T9SS type A sorting domain-containing protein [Bacteroidota bacterium]
MKNSRLFLFALLFIASSAGAVNTPNLTGPTNNITDVRAKVALQWSNVASATYQYQFDTTDLFNSNMLLSNIITGTSVEMRELSYNTKYYWRVRAFVNTDSSLWSATRNFKTLDAFEFSSPTNNSTKINPTLSVLFKRTGGFVRLTYDTTPAFNSPALTDTIFADTINVGSSSPTSTNIILRKLYWGKKYYFKGIAYHGKDSLKTALAYAFTVKPYPVITTPANNATNVFPFFTPNSEVITIGSMDSDYVFLYEIDTTTGFNSGYKRALLKYNGTGEPAFTVYFNQTYYIRTRVFSSKDTSPWSMVSTFKTTDKPALVFPQGSITYLNIDSNYFRTTVMIGSTGYEYKVDTTPLFNSPVWKGDTMNFLSYYGQMSLKNLFFGRTIYVAIRAFSAIDTSEWLVKTYLTPASPALFSPSPFSTFMVTNPVLSWQSFKSVTGATIQVDTPGSNWQSGLFMQKDTTNVTSFTTPDLRYDQEYIWRVKLRTSYDTSAWSETWQFRTSPFAVYINNPLQYEANVAINPTFLSWDQPAGARGYHYQVDTDSLFEDARNVFIKDGTKTSDNLNGLQYSTKYYLRVRCYNNADTADWYYLRVFTTQAEPPTPIAPRLLSPANGAVNQSYSQLPLSWQAVANATVYEIHTALDSIFSNPIAGSFAETELAFTGAPATVYFWRVRAKNGNKTGPWSTTFKFTTVVPVLPPLNLAPDNFKVAGATYALLQWDAVDGASYYQLQYANDPFFSGSPIIQVNNVEKDISGLTSNLTYYWRVRTIVAAFVSAWSDYAIFRTAATGLADIALNKELSLYPSPTKGVLHLPAMLLQQARQIELYDMKGALVFTVNTPAAEINISQLPEGIYTVKIVTADDVLQQRVVKE